MKKLSLSNFSPKNLSKDGGLSAKLPKGIKPNQLAMIAASVILLALTIYFSIAYINKLDTKDNLEKTIQQKEQQIAVKPLKNIAELRTKLDDARTNLSENAPFPISLDNKEMVDQLIQLRRDANIPGFGLPPSGTSSITLGTASYTVKSYSISVGTPLTLRKVINFLKNLEELPYDTSYIDGLSQSKSGDLWTFSLKFNVILQKQ